MSAKAAAPTAVAAGKNILVWFRNDLRIADHEALSQALTLAAKNNNNKQKQNSTNVLPFYCFDRRLFTTTSRIAKIPRISHRRAQFLLECVADLRNNIVSLQGNNNNNSKSSSPNLIVRYGLFHEEIAKAAQEFNVATVIAHKETTSEEVDDEKQVTEALAKLGVTVQWFWTHTMVHKDDLPYASISEVSNIYTPFKNRILKSIKVRKEIAKPENDANFYLFPKQADDDQQKQQQQQEKKGSNNSTSGPGEMPTLQQLFQSDKPIALEKEENAVLQFKGGETEAMKRLNEYFWTTKSLKEYKEKRNGLLGANYSSKLSTWLAYGCISPRTIYHQVKQFQGKHGSSGESTDHFISELIWRDYYRFLAEKNGIKIFRKKGILERDLRYTWPKDKVKFDAWCNGKTGYPFIDANMRELTRTGWMSNRGRQVVASFLAKDLNVDWRMGAEYFECHLLDFDVTQNWCNWNWASGVGCDPRDRYFSPLKQSLDYDENGKFIKTWVSELQHVSGSSMIHVPFAMSDMEQKSSKVVIGKTYPKPICFVNPPSTMKKALKDVVMAGLQKHAPKGEANYANIK